MNLVIVESPTKAKTLTRFLGKDYEIRASMGHIRDLPKSKLGVDVDNNFEPVYEVVKGKNKVIAELRKAAKGKKQVYIATDPDREGEAIGYHVEYLLKLKDAKRIVFHEITKDAIEESLKHPGKVDLKLMEAQQARRILDRLVGYKLSPVLWKKVRRGLSAGRVQSVAVRLVVEREAEINAFKPVEFWEVAVDLKKDKEQFTANLAKIDGKKPVVADESQAKEVVAELKQAEYKVSQVQEREVKQWPSPPLITSTMQRAASNRMGWSAKKTMREAQRLYEEGLITYHRTDSVNLAESAVTKARAYIGKRFGPEFVPDKPVYYKKQSKMVQGAHEAIRPTNPAKDSVATGSADKLYRLIWERMIMSQMKPAVVKKTRIVTETGKTKKNYQLWTEGERYLFKGFLAAGSKEQLPIEVPLVKANDLLDLVAVKPVQKFTTPPARYSEASLIKVLEQKGIGRPSTYAPILSTIQDRRYVERKERSLYPTTIGTTVTEFLLKHFSKVMDYDFTAGMEDDLDNVALGKLGWQKLLKNFYTGFADSVKVTEEKAERMKIAVEKTGEKCPTCGKGDVVIREGRFGKFLSCELFPECKYTATYKQIVAGVVCEDCGGEVVIKRSKRGKTFYGCGNYPKCKWASWNKPKVPEKT